MYMRRGRIHLIKVAIGAIIVLAVFYFLFSDSNVHSRAKSAISSRFTANKPKERPVFTKGGNSMRNSNKQFSIQIIFMYRSELGNYEPKNEKKREGPGEYGEPYNLPEDKQNLADASEMEYGMNIACSDEISLDRAVKDTRLEECKHWNYAKDLPRTSVIIVFHNEGWSVLLRTVHSVLNRTPKHLLHEILLVDDFSDKENLKDKLTNYLERFNGKVRLIRNSEREGLIRTRSRGAQEATGEVIVFLDAHCEVNTNWLPPLLAPIYADRTVMTVPVIDGIDHKSFEYRPVYSDNHHYRG